MANSAIIRVGVVGLGMGRVHLEAFQRSPLAKVQALCDANPILLQQTAREFGVPEVFASYEEFLERAEIEAVALVVPNYLHRPMTLQALARGWHVLGEKPMAMDAPEARIMREAIRSSGCKFMIHFNQRFQPQHQYCKTLIEAGKLGEIYYASAGWRRMRGWPRFGGWFGQKAKSGGGPLIDLGIHLLDLARWLMGGPKAVTVSACTFAHLGRALAREQNKEFDVEDLASALVRFDNGACLVLEASWALNFEEREKVFLELSGANGGLSSITYDYRDTNTCVFRQENGAMVKTVPLFYPDPMETAQEHFLRCIIEDRAPVPGADDGVEIMAILDAIYESARVGREIELRQIDLHTELPAGPAVAPAQTSFFDVASAEVEGPRGAG